MPIIETKKLTRKYGTFTAVDSLDIAIEAGEAFALLGLNGAGKTTAIKMLTTLLPVSSGDAFINGFSIITQPNEVRKMIGTNRWQFVKTGYRLKCANHATLS